MTVCNVTGFGRLPVSPVSNTSRTFFLLCTNKQNAMKCPLSFLNLSFTGTKSEGIKTAVLEMYTHVSPDILTEQKYEFCSLTS